MIEKKVKEFFDPYTDIPIEAWYGFSKYLKPFQFKKNELLKQTGSNENYLHLILSGSAGLFVYKDGHDICIDLCYEGQFTGDYFSLLRQQKTILPFKDKSEISQLLQKPSPIYVMALEPLETLAISKEDLFNLYEQSEIGGKIARMVAEILFMQKQQQQIELLTQTAEQRYISLLEQQPNILQRTASKHIASFLGITPESFSRIRKKIFC
jgi:CRP-like cAMP-binding protein